MPPKRKAESSSSSPATKRPRQKITLQTKLEILDMYKRGLSTSDIRRKMPFAESTLRTIKDSAASIEAMAKKRGDLQLSYGAYKRKDPYIEDMESMLLTFLNYLRQQNVPVSGAMIQSKAVELYNEVKNEAEGKEKEKEKEADREADPSDKASGSDSAKASGSDSAKPSGSTSDSASGFMASRGWLHRFCKRHGFESANLHGEAASADAPAAKKYLDTLEQLIMEEGYTEKQIFNIDESCIYFKKMPRRTYLHRKDKRFRSALKDNKMRITVCVGGNAAGHKLKPFIVHKHANPRALKGVNRASLPVYFFNSKSAWVDQQMFDMYFTDYLIPELTAYATQERIENKFLVLLDNARVHSNNLTDFSDQVRVEFLPKNTTSLIQPMDQGPIRMLQTNYLAICMRQLNSRMSLNTSQLRNLRKEQSASRSASSSSETDSDSESDEEGGLPLALYANNRIMKFWSKFNIYDCITNLGQAWGNVSQNCMMSSWKKLCPYLLEGLDFRGFDIDDAVAKERLKALTSLKNAGLREADEKDIEEVLTTEPTLSLEELKDIQSAHERRFEQQRVVVVPEPPKEISIEQLEKFFYHLEAAKGILQDYDCNAERACRAINLLTNTTAIYQRLLNQKRDALPQKSITSFFSSQPRATTSTEEEEAPAALPPTTPKRVGVATTSKTPSTTGSQRSIRSFLDLAVTPGTVVSLSDIYCDDLSDVDEEEEIEVERLLKSQQEKDKK